jgi:menaquinone-specific isochorismate synthase
MISDKIDWQGQYRIIQTAKVQHLYKQLCCILKESINDKILLECLHPTPALAGLMQEMALSFIQEHEPFDRGWYGGCIGWISQDAADFAVSIRSALVCKNKIHLFAGTGIVEGSDPKKEWDELDHKISQFGALLHE